MIEDNTFHEGLKRLANTILSTAQAAPDASGGYVGCVVEAMMGQTAGLMAIAQSIDYLAEAIRETKGGTL